MRRMLNTNSVKHKRWRELAGPEASDDDVVKTFNHYLKRSTKLEPEIAKALRNIERRKAQIAGKGKQDQ